MRFWRKGKHRRRKGELHESAPSDEACEALRQVQRGLVDAARRDLATEHVVTRFMDTIKRNHIADAVTESIRRKAS